MYLLRPPICASDRIPDRFYVISMEFQSLSRRRSFARNVPSGEERGKTGVFAGQSKSGFIKKQISCGRILFYLQYFTFDAILCLTTLDIPILRFLPKATDKSQEKQVCWFQKLSNEERHQTILAGLQIQIYHHFDGPD